MEIFLKIVKRAGLFNRDLRVTEKQSSSVIFKLTLPELIFELKSTPSPGPNPQTLPLRSR